jgi:Tetratricopeptide repeat
MLDQKPDQKGVVLVHLLSNLGAVYFHRQDYAGAGRSFRLAVEASGKSAMVPPRDVANVLRNYAICLRKSGQKSLAVQEESRAKQILSVLPPEHIVDVSQLTRR